MGFKCFLQWCSIWSEIIVLLTGPGCFSQIKSNIRMANDRLLLWILRGERGRDSILSQEVRKPDGISIGCFFLNLFKFKLVHNHGQRSGFERYVRGHHVTLLTVFLSITTIMSAIRNLKVRTPRLSSFKQRSMCFKNYKATPAWPGKRYNLLSFEKIYIYHKLNPKILQYFPQSEAAGVHEAKPGELLIWLQWWKWQEVKNFWFVCFKSPSPINNQNILIYTFK